MRIFNFFVKKIFLKKVLLTFSTILLLFILNYTAFTAVRSVLSTYQGYQEIKCMNREGTYIANLDPDCDMDFGVFGENDIQIIYDYLNEKFNYAFFTDGFIVSLPNDEEMEISVGYTNKEYYNFCQYELSQGNDLYFDYDINQNEEIPILVGKGLSEEYPVGSTIKMEDPALEKEVHFKVQGILNSNTSRSNYYALNSKYYYNFSIIVPVNKDYIKKASFDLLVNGLMEIVVTQTTNEEMVDLSKFIQDHIGLKINFFGQEENLAYFSEYYLGALKTIAIVSGVLIVIITCLSVWISFVTIRLMLKDFTINLLVGLSYIRLRKIFYCYFAILYLINLVILFIITAVNRYGGWLRKEATSVTYGLFGLIGMDWLALLIVLIFDVFIGLIIVGIMMKKIRKIPISLGVLQ